MDIELLNEFTTLAIVRNYSDAARLLCVSQPTLSRHMIALEKKFGFRLFARTVPVTLTGAGEQMLAYAQEVLTAYDSMLEAARSLARNPKRTIIVQDYSHSALPFAWISKQERAFEKLNDAVSIRNVDCPSARSQADALKSGALDVAFMYSFDAGGEPAMPLLEDGLVATYIPALRRNLAFYLRKDNKLLKTGAPPSLRDLAETKILSPAERYLDAFRSSLSDFFLANAGVAPQYDFKQVSSRRFFYTLDPGESAYVVRSRNDGEAEVPTGFSSDLALVEFPEYWFNTFAVIDDERADDEVRALVELFGAEG